MELVGAWGSVLYVAHLYEACRQGGYLKQIWPDMEVVMDVHSRQRIFAGRVPQTPAESLKCMQLTLGVSPVNFARSNRLNGVKRSYKNRRELSFDSPVMNLFQKQWVETGDTILTMSTVQGLLLNQQPASTLHNTTARDENQNLVQKQSLLEKQWATSHKMTPLQLLDTLCNAISAEEHILRFDYISLHVRCLQVLRTLQTVLSDQLRHCFGSHYIDNEMQLFYIIYYIFKEAAEFAKLGKSLKQKPVFETSMLKQASEVVEACIEREGSLECDKLEKICVSWSRNKAFCTQSEEAKSVT